MANESHGPWDQDDYADKDRQQITRPTAWSGKLMQGSEKHRQWVLYDPKPRLTVLTRATINLPDQTVA
jgi:hypothetical protein